MTEGGGLTVNTLRSLRALAPVATLALVAIGTPRSFAAELPGEPPVTMELQRLSEHCWMAQGAAGAATENAGFISNAGVIVTDAGVIVFDALGTPALARMLLQRIRAITDRPIRYAVVSHYHADHVYRLQVFEDAGAEVVAPAGVEQYLTSTEAASRLEERRERLAPWVDAGTRLVWPDRTVAAVERLRLGGVELTLTPMGSAHSDADLAMYVEPDGVLYSGDLIFEGRVPFVGDANTRNWLAALERMGERRLTALVPGHGPPAGDPDAAVRLTRGYVAYLRENMGAAVAEMVPFEEAYEATDWSSYAAMPAFADANRRNAYQVYLSIEEEALAAP
jgi:glyoxylase-like metal-dependent hydrolase (beta-lactamase superfamily II)